MAAAAAPLPPAARAPPGGVAGRAVEAAAAAEPGEAARAEGAEGLFVVLGAGLAAASHPLLYVKLLVQVGHEPLPPTVGRNVLGRKVLYLPGFFTYARHIVEVDGKRGLFRGLTPRLISSTLSTITRGSVKKAFPLEDMEHVSNKDDVKTSLRKVVKETSHEMMMQCVSRVVSHPLHVISMRCMVQFVGREVKYSGVFSAIGRIFKEEGILGFFVGLVPRILGDVIFLWCCNLLAHFINTYAVDDNPGIGDPELHKIRDGDRCEHADVPVPSRGRSHGSEQLWVACRPPSLRSRVYILDPLLEVSQCSGAAVPRLQPALPQSAHASHLLPRRLTPRQGAVMNSDSSRNPKLVSIRVYFFFSIRSPWCQSKTPPLQQGQQQVGFWRFGFRLQLDQSSILMAVSSRTCSREHRRVLSCLFGPGCSSGVTGEVWETRKCPGTKRASPEMQGQKTASFCLS